MSEPMADNDGKREPTGSWYQLSLDALLEFYDRKTHENEYHATSINALMGEEFALALVTKYFELGGRGAEILSEKCVTGEKSGPRLDGWLRIKNGKETVLYQTEIKNWSAHAVGGKSVPKNASEDAWKNHRINRWENQFDTGKKTLKEKSALKVLVPMKLPDGIPESVDRRPLIVFWDPMNPDGKPDEWFDVEVEVEAVEEQFNRKSKFTRLYVFSISNFVRKLKDQGKTHVVVDLPKTKKRLQWIERLLTSHSP